MPRRRILYIGNSFTGNECCRPLAIFWRDDAQSSTDDLRAGLRNAVHRRSVRRVHALIRRPQIRVRIQMQHANPGVMFQMRHHQWVRDAVIAANRVQKLTLLQILLSRRLNAALVGRDFLATTPERRRGRNPRVGQIAEGVVTEALNFLRSLKE